jgi:pimeloyl-ACP methyl ester carboxylesterase
MVALMDSLSHQRFAMGGCDTGMFIPYALATDHPDRLDRLVVGEAFVPGVSPSPPLYVPGPLNERLWHLAFNRLSMVNEDLVRGREDIFFGAEYAAERHRITGPQAVHRSTSSRPSASSHSVKPLRRRRPPGADSAWTAQGLSC